ncbi:hypothetical protein ACFVYP_04645 [Kitasatospora sp. NPDC058201]|uniref:hypothetical protein n=1 Tax=Streptomycetaceae TaxID=2062 RepID=UPI002E788665|nr:hypothetical protein [Streptomyces sp. BE303]MED7953745.1 hypothetical protein [Streptomyces sp. BE303]
MNRLSRSFAVLALSATALLTGTAAAQAAAPPGATTGDLSVDPKPVEQVAAAYRCDVEYTVAYYSYRQQGYPELESLLHAEKTYALCAAVG